MDTQTRRRGRRQARLWVLPLALLLVQTEQVGAGALERAMLGKSMVVDLTHVVTERAPAGGGQDNPRPEVLAEEDRNSTAQRLPLSADLATHLDLPASIVKGKPTVAQVPAREFLVHAVLVDIGAKVAQTPDYRATVEDLQAWERRNGRIPKGSAVLLHTGWARRWSDAARYLNLDAQGVPRVPGFSPGAMAFLISQRDIRGVGMDTWGAEVPPGTHGGDDGMRPLLQAGKWQLVNLTNLDRLPAKGAKLVVAPLRLEAGSAPARVIAILP
ncbi:MAG: cyclase family protein [candidate division NC10 bacterium]|nr:cyclase family protein [candidate division NC10 bacterium]